MTAVIKPKGLRRGDAISVIAPAGPVNRERMGRALARIEERGFRIKMHGDIFRSRGYLAGDDAKRADELMAAFSDQETTAVWCARGGYGVARILNLVDFDLIRRNPKVFIGFSDITLLHVAIQQRTGLLTFHGPNLQDGFGKPEDIPLANESALWRAVMEASEQSAERASAYAIDYSEIPAANLRTIRSGKTTGSLIGGNLAVICGVMGTPFEIETAGRILFLEDISERLYRIDRYLSQLTLAGKLSQAAGVLLGDFSYEDGDHAESEADLVGLFHEYLSPLAMPVLAGFPAGHEQFNLTLPMGALVSLDADQKCITVCERPTE
jgi:muramoyltetrapeptide carboxypeptidase